MRITNNTPLENLPEYETLSAWAKNVCQNSDIFTLADLMNTPESELLKKRNCGKRTLEELQSIKLKYSVIPVDGEMQSAVRKRQSGAGHVRYPDHCIIHRDGI